MANSKYEYVKEFESKEKLSPETFVLVEVKGVALGLDHLHNEALAKAMESSAQAMLREFPGIVLAYTYADRAYFALPRTFSVFNRRFTKIFSSIVSTFSSLFVEKFESDDGGDIPFFRGKLFQFALLESLVEYLASRQEQCHRKYLYETCYRELVRASLISPTAVPLDAFKGTHTESDCNELLFTKCGINYNNLPDRYKKGSFFWLSPGKRKTKKIENSCQKDLRKDSKFLRAALGEA